MAELVRPFRGISADDRRAQRRARLIEAGLDVVGEVGIAKLTMTAVCRRAGLTQRYFYESFADRDALLLAMLAAAVAATDTAGISARSAAGDDVYARCRATVGAAVTVLTDDPRLARAFVESVGSASLRPHLDAALERYAEFLADELAGRRRRTPRDRRRLRLAATVLVGGITDAAAAWLDGRLDSSREQLIDECAHLCVAASASVDARSAQRRRT